MIVYVVAANGTCKIFRTGITEADTWETADEIGMQWSYELMINDLDITGKVGEPCIPYWHVWRVKEEFLNDLEELAHLSYTLAPLDFVKRFCDKERYDGL